MTHPAKLSAITAILATIAACSASPLAADAARSPVKARAARVLKATDTARLHFIPPARGSLFIEEGKATGTLPGTMRVSLDAGTTFSGSFKLTTPSGTITGRGSAVPRLGSGDYESFAGTLTVTGGTGRYAHAHGRTGLYGSFYRGEGTKEYSLVIQTTGNLSY
jgi:hypothetical protein